MDRVHLAIDENDALPELCFGLESRLDCVRNVNKNLQRRLCSSSGGLYAVRRAMQVVQQLQCKFV